MKKSQKETPKKDEAEETIFVDHIKCVVVLAIMSIQIEASINLNMNPLHLCEIIE